MEALNATRESCPSTFLAYWKEHGWCGYADGLLWTVDPQEYEPVVKAWIGNTPFMQEDTFHIIARSAFGKLYFWGEKSGGDKLNIIAADSFALARTFQPAKDLDQAARAFFGAKSRDAVDYKVEQGNDMPISSTATSFRAEIQKPSCCCDPQPATRTTPKVQLLTGRLQ